jgi:hypothetical protein
VKLKLPPQKIGITQPAFDVQKPQQEKALQQISGRRNGVFDRTRERRDHLAGDGVKGFGKITRLKFETQRRDGFTHRFDTGISRTGGKDRRGGALRSRHRQLVVFIDWTIGRDSKHHHTIRMLRSDSFQSP